MSLEALVTPSQLRRIAGYAFARGDGYFREGRVEHCEVRGNQLRGIVAGSRVYAVRVTAQRDGLSSDCTCPMGYGFCKHAVALALHWREHGAAPASDRPAPGAEDMFATEAEAERWAANHDVTHVLALAADKVVAELRDPMAAHGTLSYLLARVPLRAVVSRAGAVDLCDGLTADRLAAAARRVLVAEAESIAAGLAEERAPREGPRDGAPAVLWARLVELRRGLRRTAVPRGRAAREPSRLQFDRGALTLTWSDRDRTPGASRGIGVRLSLPSGGPPELRCGCGARDGACVHGLALVDAAFDVLADAGRAAEAADLAAELVRPGWSRALAALAQRAAQDAAPQAAIELWWELEPDVDRPSVTPVVKRQTKRGTFSAGARITPGRLLDDFGDRLSDVDRRIAEHAAAWLPGQAATYPVRAFLALVGHPRVVLAGETEAIAVTRATLGFTAVAAGDALRLVPAVDGARFDGRLLAALLQAFRPGEPLVDFDRGVCRLVDAGADARHLAQLLVAHGDVFPPESHNELFERLAALEARMPVEVPDTLKGTELVGETVVVVRVRFIGPTTLELEAAVRPARGAPLFAPGAGPKDVLVVRDGERGYVRRNLTDELAHVRGMLVRLPLDSATEGPPLCFQLSDDDALALVLALEKPPPGIEAEWIETRPRIQRSLGADALRIQIENKHDWFGLNGDVKIESGRIELAVLLDAARRQRRFVRAGDDRWVELSDLLRERLAAVAQQTFAAKGRVDGRFDLGPGAVPAVRALADAGAEVDAAPRWRLLGERLAASEKLRPKPPRTLAAKLRDYQIDGHAWLSRLAAWGAGACLADDMGLGKTVQAIALLVDRARLGPALVLAPTSVVFNWAEELARFAPELRFIQYGADPDRAGTLARLGPNDVLVASYGLLARDGVQLASRAFATLVIDEAQALKNAATRRAKAARALDAEFRVALTGTPLENHVGELWSVFSVVFPGLLGSWDQFRERFALPIERGKDPEARAALSQLIRPFLLRRTKQEVARELPARTEIALPIELAEAHLALYEDARLAAVAELSPQHKKVRDEQQRFQVLAALTRLRLLACHPQLYDATSTVPSAKLERVLELVAELRSEGHRALVFSQFTSHLALVRTALAAAGHRLLYLDGATPGPRRAELVREFQAGSADAFLISLKAGGTGINLTAADYVIHLDPWWNPAVEDQATDRAHRIGQTRPVTVYRMIARGTIEERIVALHADKRSLVADILAGAGTAAKLSTRDLLALLA